MFVTHHALVLIKEILFDPFFCPSTMLGIQLYSRSTASNNVYSALIILQEVRLASLFDLLISRELPENIYPAASPEYED